MSAIEKFKKSVELEPVNPENSMNLVEALQAAGLPDSATEAARNAFEYFQSIGRFQDAENFKNLLRELQSQKSPNQ